MKVFMMVIMPLITGGALTKLLSQFGIRLPAMFAGMAGGRGGEFTSSARIRGAIFRTITDRWVL